MSLPRPSTVECSVTYGDPGIEPETSASSSSSSSKGSFLLYCCDSATSSTMCSSKQTDSASLVVDVESQKSSDDAAMIDILLHLLDNDSDVNIDNYCSARLPPQPPAAAAAAAGGAVNNAAAVSTLPDELEFFSWDELWESNPGSGAAAAAPNWEGAEVAEALNEWEIDEWMVDAEMDFGGSGTLEIQDP